MDSNNANENDNGDRETKKKVPKKLLKRGFVDFKVREPKKDKFGEDKYGKDIESSKKSTNYRENPPQSLDYRGERSQLGQNFSFCNTVPTQIICSPPVFNMGVKANMPFAP
jgi:hypothetical protein